jgi:hypothetical protein
MAIFMLGERSKKIETVRLSNNAVKSRSVFVSTYRKKMVYLHLHVTYSRTKLRKVFKVDISFGDSMITK